MPDARDRALLERLFRAAVAASDPAERTRAALPPRPRGRTVVVGLGKAAMAMAEGLVAGWDGPLEGVVVARAGQGGPGRIGPIDVLEASHPTPDAGSVAAAERLLAAVRGLTADDLVIALVSGGGSALACAPLPGLTLADKQAVTRALLASGATIDEMNRVRQRLSAIKGGRLAAAAAPAPVVTLAVSDVPGDAPWTIASGPTVPAPRNAPAAERILERYGIALPDAVRAALADPASHPPSDLPTGETRIIASPRLALEAATRAAEAGGVAARILSDRIEGEARDAGIALSGIALWETGQGGGPRVLLSGGETTVTIRGAGGRGGPNGEFALGAAIALRGAPVAGLAADTDGIDGTEANAGAFFDGGSVARMASADVDAFAALDRHDCWGAFDAAGDLFVTGPTGTNVNDFRAFLIR